MTQRFESRQWVPFPVELVFAFFANPSNFTSDGFLTLGFCGHQPGLANIYSNNGSMYITAESLLPLGLRASDSFWAAPAEDWTAKRAYAGMPFTQDHALED